MRKALIIISVILTTACSTTTIGPTPVGKDKYVMSRQEGAFPSGDEPLLQEILEQAGRFCKSLDKNLELSESHENSGPFIMGNYPKATITFECIE